MDIQLIIMKGEGRCLRRGVMESLFFPTAIKLSSCWFMFSVLDGNTETMMKRDIK